MRLQAILGWDASEDLLEELVFEGRLGFDQERSKAMFSTMFREQPRGPTG